MGNWKNCNSLLLTALACICTLLSYGQPILQSSVDKREILIGEQFTLTIKADLSTPGYTLYWSDLPDSMGHFEVLRSHIDSLYTNRNLSGIVRTITFTSFDSGKWALPPFLVKIKSLSQDSVFRFFTDSVPVTVSFSATDTTRQLRDIKPIREAETIRPIWYWVVGSIGLLLAILLLMWWWRKRRLQRPGQPAQSSLSAYEEAMQELKILADYNLSVPEEVKRFHSKLATISKQYLSHKYQQAYLNTTTVETLLLLKGQQLDHELLTKVSASLRCGDAVKFAKYFPPISETENCRNSVVDLINTLEQLKVATKPLNS